VFRSTSPARTTRKGRRSKSLLRIPSVFKLLGHGRFESVAVTLPALGASNENTADEVPLTRVVSESSMVSAKARGA